MTKDIDPSSAEPVIYYVGPGVVAGVPADDLSGNQLARLAWIAHGQKGSPADASPAHISAIRDELVATGNYRATKPKD